MVEALKHAEKQAEKEKSYADDYYSEPRFDRFTGLWDTEADNEGKNLKKD